jgi:predicted HTH domain antitoxin
LKGSLTPALSQRERGWKKIEENRKLGYKLIVKLDVSSSLVEGQSPKWVAVHLGIGLYVSGEATLGQAAEVAGVSQKEFLQELDRRDIPLNYSMDDLKSDLATVRELAGQ